MKLEKEHLEAAQAARRLHRNADFQLVQAWLVKEWEQATLNADPTDALELQRAHYKYLAVADFPAIVEMLATELENQDGR